MYKEEVFGAQILAQCIIEAAGQAQKRWSRYSQFRVAVACTTATAFPT